MDPAAVSLIPEAQRECAREALDEVSGNRALSLEPLAGGASGALKYRVDTRSRCLLLRIETRMGALRNPHQYRCMAIAAEAGIAPTVRFLDEERGVVVMDFIESASLSDHPGGSEGLVVAAAELTRRLQATHAFPELLTYRALLERMLDSVCTSGRFADGLLDPHVDAFARISAAYPFDASPRVSSHNDPNRHNLLFDGQRLWLIDWETAYRNDPLTDVAILAENLAATPELERHLLRAWHGGPSAPELEARLHLMRLLTRLYYAGLVLAPRDARAVEPDDSLEALGPEELTVRVSTGELVLGTPAFLHALGKMFLAGFLEGARGTPCTAALDVLGGR